MHREVSHRSLGSLWGSLHSGALFSKIWLPWSPWIFCSVSTVTVCWVLPRSPRPALQVGNSFNALDRGKHRTSPVSHVSEIIVLDIRCLEDHCFIYFVCLGGCFKYESKSGHYYHILAGRRNPVFCFLYITMNSWFLYISFVLIHCNHFSFWGWKYPSLGQWEPLHVGFCVFLTCFY